MNLERRRLKAHNSLLRMNYDAEQARVRFPTYSLPGEARELAALGFAAAAAYGPDEIKAAAVARAIIAALRYNPVPHSDSLGKLVGSSTRAAYDLSMLAAALRGQPRPGAWSSWLAACVARMLPVAHRIRYSEEFRNELSEVGGRFARGRYSVRLLWSVVGLRRALRDVVPEVESW